MGKLCVHAGADVKREGQQLTETEEKGASVLVASGAFHCYQPTTSNPEPNHAIPRSATMTPLEIRFVFHVHGVGTCHAARVWSRRFSYLS